MRFEVLTAMTMMITIFWDVTLIVWYTGSIYVDNVASIFRVEVYATSLSTLRRWRYLNRKRRYLSTKLCGFTQHRTAVIEGNADLCINCHNEEAG
jgi:hypothetical protein